MHVQQAVHQAHQENVNLRVETAQSAATGACGAAATGSIARAAAVRSARTVDPTAKHVARGTGLSVTPRSRKRP